jgi:hypothetical protein
MSEGTHIERPAAIQRVRDTAKGALRQWGILTAGPRRVPDLLVIGAKRGGTTSLWKYLEEHPGVMHNFPRAQNIKGTYFFSTYYGRGERWYRSHFPSDVARSVARRRLGYDPIAAESTPYYLYHPLAPARAAQLAPNAVVVALLRDPVERAFSHWKERCQHAETLSFADAVAAEPDRCRGEEERILADPNYVSFAHRHLSYVAQSSYVPMVERWRAHYPADQFIVWISEEFYARPQEHLDELTARLGLPSHHLVDATPYNGFDAPDMAAATRAALTERFRPQVDELSALLGRDLPWLGATAPAS